jgi:hypothetical protein
MEEEWVVEEVAMEEEWVVEERSFKRTQKL